MKMKQILAPLVFMAMGMFATASYAINTVTGVSAPATATVGATVPISVAGDKGVCSTQIDYTNNGSWDASVSAELFPHGYSTSYGSPGMKTIKARGGREYY